MSLVIAGDLSSHHLRSGRHKLLDDLISSSRHVAGLAATYRKGPPIIAGRHGAEARGNIEIPAWNFAIITLLVGFLGLVGPIVMFLRAAW